MKNIFTIARFKFVVLGWAGASLFFTAVLMISDLGGHKPLGFALYANAVHFALWTMALPLLSKATQAFPLRRGNRTWNAVALLLLVAVLGALVMLGQWAIVFSTFFPERSDYLTFGAFMRSETVRFLPGDVLIGIVIVLALEGWRTLLDFQAEHTRTTELERQLAVSRLEALRMQLHPHFLFNTLHTIAGLIAEQPPTARRMVIALGDLLRLTLKENSDTVRSLGEELEFADLYLGIEKLRLGERLALDYEIEPEATSAEVPQLLLQPLFENAVRHGAARTVASCQIQFRAHREGEKLHLSLQNDGPLQATAAGGPAFGVGLTNTMARLRLYYKSDFTFQYQNRPQGGVRIDLLIPYNRADNRREDGSKEQYALGSSAGTHADY